MLSRFVLLTLCLLFSASAVWAQGAQQSASSGQATPVDEQSDVMRDTLKRMQIKREEEEHKKLLSKGFQIKQETENLNKNAVKGWLPRASEKQLKDIEKAAKHIRSEFGGSQDNPLESPPETLAETLKMLTEKADQLNEGLAKTSRHIVSFAVVEEATEIIQLVKLLRSYLK